ncbi:hypothetical protein F9U42_04490 [Pectobacterium versatile]|uniref:hypothetical protein n=1 Tax=Pectobacterium versatile TaxID=2488639 RepID=UPI001B36B0F6|nr:hypothetical protein [Pectobacterium versatile]MBQ4766391.1 hypothetical protein [Pectobacterium versatile]
MILYHGTIVPGIKQFRIGVTGKGELDTPVNCIWLTDTFAAAKTHALSFSKHRQNATNAYIYEVEIACDAIVADTGKRKEIQSSVNKKIVCSHSGALSYLLGKHDWLSAISYAVGDEGYVASKNGMFEILLDAGVHLLANPAFDFETAKSKSKPNIFSNPGSGIDYALLDVTKATILNCTQVCGKEPQ